MDFDLFEAGSEEVEGEKAADERLADTEDQLERLGGLEGSGDAGEDAEHSGFRATGGFAGGRGLGEEAPVAGTAGGVEDGELALESEDGGVDVRLLELDAGVADHVAGSEVVGAIGDDVVSF